MESPRTGTPGEIQGRKVTGPRRFLDGMAGLPKGSKPARKRSFLPAVGREREMGPIRFFSSRRRRPAAAALALVIGGFSPWTAAARGGPAPSPCASGKPADPPDARRNDRHRASPPRRAARRGPARGARPRPALQPRPAARRRGCRASGFFDGLRFDYTHPQVEIVTESRAPERLFELAAEIDAESLGLHEKKIASAGEAMDIFQQELTVQFRERGKDPAAVAPTAGAAHPLLRVVRPGLPRRRLAKGGQPGPRLRLRTNRGWGCGPRWRARCS